MTTDTGISDEMVELVARALAVVGDDDPDKFWQDYLDEANAALSAVAPLLRAEGMREAAEMAQRMIERHSLSGVKQTILARADVLTKPKEPQEK